MIVTIAAAPTMTSIAEVVIERIAKQKAKGRPDGPPPDPICKQDDFRQRSSRSDLSMRGPEALSLLFMQRSAAIDKGNDLFFLGADDRDLVLRPAVAARA